ncbi:MAG: heme ABC exporter ATP-binding protein CcmA [Acidobacteria bacterium]|nr:heme ABC exporter ATP-binding protein CcmA [Acidobacteriota bacterium]
MILVQSVSKYFGYFPALRDITFGLDLGRFLTIFGPNGAGKTTLLKIIASLSKPTSGSVRIDGYDCHTQSQQIRGRLGYISHQSLLYPQLTARENLTFFGRLYDLRPLEARVQAALSGVGLQDWADQPIRTFSHGMKQRLTIARALLPEPSVLVLDEPFTGLDSYASEILRRLLHSLKNERRVLLMTTHHLGEGLDLADRVMILHRGQIRLEEEAYSYSREEFGRLYAELVSETR